MAQNCEALDHHVAAYLLFSINEVLRCSEGSRVLGVQVEDEAECFCEGGEGVTFTEFKVTRLNA